MKLGIIAEPTKESFEKAKKRGIEALEFCLHPKGNIENYNEKIKKIYDIKKNISEYNISIASIGSFGADKLDTNGEVIEEEIKMGFELVDVAKAVDCPVVVVGCNYVDNISYLENVLSAIKYLGPIIEYGKKHSVKIATYNCRMNNFIVDDRAWTMIHLYLKDLGIKYDPSHSVYAGADYLKELRDWGDRIYHFHLKGAIKIEEQRYDDPPIGLDEIKWQMVMAILYAKKYDGTLSLEPHSENWTGELGEKGIDFSVKYIKSLMF